MDQMNDDDELINQLMRELAAEKDAQIEGAKLVIKPVVFIAAVTVFILCFWWYEIGLLLSIGAATLAIPTIGAAVAIPIGYILGKRAARQLMLTIEGER
jgi:hypothetical protein